MASWATAGKDTTYRITIDGETWSAVVSWRETVLTGEGPLRVYIGRPLRTLMRDCKRLGWTHTIE